MAGHGNTAHRRPVDWVDQDALLPAHGPASVNSQLRFPAKSPADFKCDTSDATKPKGMCASRREIYYSIAHERTTIIYPDDDGPAVADVCYPNRCSEGESSTCGS
jgi:hypothetical protein